MKFYPAKNTNTTAAPIITRAEQDAKLAALIADLQNTLKPENYAKYAAAQQAKMSVMKDR